MAAAVVAIVVAAAAAAAAGAGAGAAAAAVTAVYGEAQAIATAPGKAAAAKAPIRRQATYPGPASGGVLDATATQHLTVTFAVTNAADGAPLAPHQAFVRFVPAAADGAGQITHFVAAPDSASSIAGAHRFSLDLNDRKALATLTEAGEYHVDLVIGDTAIANPVEWRVGTVKISPAQPPAKSPPPLYTTPLLYESDTTLKPLREIAHTFRAPEKRPPAVISMGAGGLVVLAVVVWVTHVLSIPGLKLMLPAFGWCVGCPVLRWHRRHHGAVWAVLAAAHHVHHPGLPGGAGAANGIRWPAAAGGAASRR